MKLYDYQEIGADTLAANPRFYLADIMGLGKTAQAISAARDVGARSVLVVCPASAVPNWHRQWRAWNPLRQETHPVIVSCRRGFHERQLS